MTDWLDRADEAKTREKEAGTWRVLRPSGGAVDQERERVVGEGWDDGEWVGEPAVAPGMETPMAPEFARLAGELGLAMLPTGGPVEPRLAALWAYHQRKVAEAREPLEAAIHNAIFFLLDLSPLDRRALSDALVTVLSPTEGGTDG